MTPAVDGFVYDETDGVLRLRNLYAENVGSDTFVAGDLTPATSAINDSESTSKANLFPRMTTTQMNAISSPLNGMMIYNTTEGKFYGYQSGAWAELGSGGGGGGDISKIATFTLDMTNDSTPQTIYTVPAGKELITTQTVLRSFTDAYSTTMVFQYAGTGGIIGRVSSAGLVRYGGTPVGYSFNMLGYNNGSVITGDLSCPQGSAGDSIQITLTAAGTGTAIVDVFGYLVDA